MAWKKIKIEEIYMINRAGPYNTNCKQIVIRGTANNRFFQIPYSNFKDFFKSIINMLYGFGDKHQIFRRIEKRKRGE